MGINSVLTGKIKDFALNEAGFDLAGFSLAALPQIHSDALEVWIKKGHAGSMDYMERDPKKRTDAQQVLPGAKSVISLVINYHHPDDPKPTDRPVGKVAKYAYGRDYHKIIEKKLKLLRNYILELSPGAQVKTYVDTGPVLEKAFAKEAGLGFFGKNTNIITKNFGSFVFLASLITDLELEPDSPHTGSCGSCRICIDACPTNALLGNYEIDARRCISYLTIESKQPIPQELQKGVGEWAFGCDICQDVCPYNHKAKTTRHAELYPNKIAGTWLDLNEIQNFSSDEQFQARFQGSPVKRAKRQGLVKNAEVVLKNISMVE